MRLMCVLIAGLGASILAYGQVSPVLPVSEEQKPVPAQVQLPVPADSNSTTGTSSKLNADAAQYTLGPDDELSIWAADVPDLTTRGAATVVDRSGYITLPMAGRIKASGLTTNEIQEEITKKLRAFIKEPQVSVVIKEFRSEPVSVLGTVNTPGVHQLRGHKTLMEILSMAGGLRTDAGPIVTITRKKETGPIPLPQAAEDPSGKYYVAHVNVESILKGTRPEYNIAIKPHDVISVQRAELVYVIGDVVKSGGFVLNDKQRISVLQALSLAGGLNRTSDPKGARILRNEEGAPKRLEIPVDVKRILSGQGEDMAMRSEDILFVPSSMAKKAGARAIEAALQTLTGIVVFRGGF